MRTHARGVSLMVAAAIVALPAVSTRAATFFVEEGFEDDVDLAVAPNGEFLVVPVEAENGATAFLDIFDLGAAGTVIAKRTRMAVLGWENGVDPVVVDAGGSMVVVAPTESEGGGAAEVRVLRVLADGSVAASVTIGLGNLGFEDDVDVVQVFYQNFGVVLPLEREDGSAAGVLAIKTSAADLGRCTLVANVPVATPCDDIIDGSGRLTAFLDGVDGIDVPNLPGVTRFAVPVAPSTVGGAADLVFFDFDFSVGPGTFVPYFGSQSVRATNAAGARPLPFPGFERDVDITVLPTRCGVLSNRILVPVEQPSGNGGDLYLVNGTNDATSGVADWRYALDGAPVTGPILGYEEGVDVVPWCDTGSVPDDLLALAVENGSGTDADLLLIVPATGALSKSVEEENAGLTILGWQKGVEPQPWSAATLLAPVDDERGRANLLAFAPDATLASSAEDPVTNPSVIILGYRRSVDPLVLPLADPDRHLYVPVERHDGTDADLRIFDGPLPDLSAPLSFETVNPGTTVHGFERDVDGTLVDKADGYEYVYVPEETATTHVARLRVEAIPPGGGTLLLLPMEGPTASALAFVRSDGSAAAVLTDVMGFERGLDPASRIGDTQAFDPPAASPPLGFDADSDNTITAERSVFGDEDGDGSADGLDCAPLDEGAFALPSEVTHLLEVRRPTATELDWDDQAATAGPATCYDLAWGLVQHLRADAGYARIACLANDLGGASALDSRAPAPGAGYYYLVRAQNACGAGTYGPAGADAAAPCP